MKNIPKRIYLQIDADGETPEDFNELVGISWCLEKVNSNDIEFILNVEIEKGEKELFCARCGKPHRMQGNGIIELLCECGA